MNSFETYRLLASLQASKYCVYIEGVCCVGKTSLMEIIEHIPFVHMVLRNDYGDNFRQDDEELLWTSFLINYPLIEAVNMQAQQIERLIVVDRGYISNRLYEIVFETMNKFEPNWEIVIKEKCLDLFLNLPVTIQSMETNTIVFVLNEESFPIIWNRMHSRNTDLDQLFTERYSDGPNGEAYYYLRVQNKVFIEFYTLMQSSGSNIKFVTLTGEMNFSHLYYFEIEEYLHEKFIKIKH